MQALLSGSKGLALIRGRWVEVKRERLERTLERFQEAERLAAGHGFTEPMRMLAGADIAPEAGPMAPIRTGLASSRARG